MAATRKAYAVLFGTVQQQSAMISFNYVFGFMTMVFLGMFPLIFLMRRPRRRGPASGR